MNAMSEMDLAHGDILDGLDEFIAAVIVQKIARRAALELRFNILGRDRGYARKGDFRSAGS